MSKEEILDIVNENDEVIGQAPRSEFEAKNLRKRVVLICIFNSEGELMVQWRASDKKMNPRQFTGSVAETVQSGESYEQAAKRGLKEELGIDVPLEEIAVFTSDGQEPRNVGLFIGEYDGEVSGWEEEADILDYWSADEAELMRTRFPYLLTDRFQQSLQILMEMEDE